MDFFSINGKSIKAPTEMTISPEHLDKAERTMDGTMVIDIIGTKKKVDVSWEYLTKEDMKTLATESGRKDRSAGANDCKGRKFDLYAVL